MLIYFASVVIFIMRILVCISAERSLHDCYFFYSYNAFLLYVCDVIRQTFDKLCFRVLLVFRISTKLTKCHFQRRV